MPLFGGERDISLLRGFNKELIKNANTGNRESQKEFLRKFLNFLPSALPSGVPASAVAVQPIVPLVEDQLLNQ